MTSKLRSLLLSGEGHVLDLINDYSLHKTLTRT